MGDLAPNYNHYVHVILILKAFHVHYDSELNHIVDILEVDPPWQVCVQACGRLYLWVMYLKDES